MNKKYIVIACILVLSILLSYDIRSQIMDYGMELDEFDPFWNYRATSYLLDNGYESYQAWHDDKSWYPTGRDVSQTSQVMLHYITAVTYLPFEDSISLYDFTILFPAIVGSLTVIPIFFLMRSLTGRDEVGVMSAVIFSFLPMVLVRGTAGWFKSEPLGLFIGVIALYFVVSGISRGKIPRLIIGGVLMTLAISAWGGIVFLLIPILIWIFILPKKDYINVGIGLAGFTIGMYVVSFGLGRTSSIISEMIVAGFLIATVYHVLYHKFGNRIRIVFGIIIVGGILLIPLGIIDTPNERYMNVLIPTYSDNPLINSVSEHQGVTLDILVTGNGVLLLLAPIGFIAVIKKKLNPFILIFSILSIYIGIVMVRLDLFLSLGLMMLSTVAIWLFFDKIKMLEKKMILPAKLGISALLIMGFVFLANDGYEAVDRPAIIILEGGVWLDALDWIENNTNQDAKIMSWWDYGYWIETKANRTTFMDNAAFHDMSGYANMLTDDPATGIKRLKELGADYVVVYFIGFADSDAELVRLGGGGDLAKLGWILKIGGRDGNINSLEDNLYTMMIPYSKFKEGWYQENPEKPQFLYRNGLELVYSTTDKEPNSRFDTVVIYRIN